MIKWGFTMTVRSQKIMLKAATGLMVVISFLGLAAIWGTYWLNLKQ
jgi:succinate dehydrogenase / fumarate reductase cytochrome b subunit